MESNSADAGIYHNSLNGEYTQIIESAAQTNGEYSLLEVQLMPGGGNPLHYHTRFTEEFTAIKGKLGIQYQEKVLHLSPGHSCLIPIGKEHRFFNDTDEPIIFRITLRKGQPGFENFIKVLFGLVNDGKTNKKFIPKNPFYAALLLHWGDTHVNNIFFKNPLAICRFCCICCTPV
ncbi:cupin domain-containing protein [Flavobacterium sp. MK4S-17]|uniref:cupin domain-containing protein n=1 Tax=Flavobacterium sp. MK4S-17 TaxID=2543737 RepID=UPI001357D92E|nr:cupin domain-containing protein [Flavobacterium sp. MK4S-17]